MEDIQKHLKASKMTLDQSQAKKMPLNASRYTRAPMFDDLGATPYSSPVKLAVKGKGKKVAASQERARGKLKEGNKKWNASSSSKEPLEDDSDDEILLRESSAHGSPSTTVQVSGSHRKNDAVSGSKLGTRTSNASMPTIKRKEVRRPTPAFKPSETDKSPIRPIRLKPQAVRRALQRKERGDVSDDEEHSVPKTQRLGSSRVDGFPLQKKTAKATIPVRTDPLTELLEEKRASLAKEENTSRPKPRLKADVKGKEKARPLQPFPMSPPLLTDKTKNKDVEGSEAGPSRRSLVDDSNTRKGLQPFPMSSQDFEGCKPVKKPSPNSSSSSSKRNSSPLSDEWAAKRRRKSNGMLEEYEFADLSIMTQIEERADPTTLCPFCDQPLPEYPSSHLVNLLERLRGSSYPDPRPTNRLGRKAPLLNYISLCQRHQFETKILPKALAKGWPSVIDFEALPGRVISRRKELLNIIRDKHKSIVWQVLRKEIETKGIRRVMGLAGQFQGFKKSQPGYYGEQGAVIIYQALYNLFPCETLGPSITAPLSYIEFIHNVLVPEVAASLVQEDMGLETIAEALEVLEESSSYGVAMFPDNENEEEVDRGRRANVGGRTTLEPAKVRRKDADEEDVLESFGPSKKVNTKVTICKPARASVADDLSLFSSCGSSSDQSVASMKKTKHAKYAKAITVSSSPDDKENIRHASSSSQTLVSGAAAGRQRSRPGLLVKSDIMDDLDETPKPIRRAQINKVTSSSTDTYGSRIVSGKDRILRIEPTVKPKLTGLSNPLEMARSRKAQGVLSAQSKDLFKYDMKSVASSDDDAEIPPSSSLPLREGRQVLIAKKDIRGSSSSRHEKESCKWLLSDEITPTTTPHA